MMSARTQKISRLESLRAKIAALPLPRWRRGTRRGAHLLFWGGIVSASAFLCLTSTSPAQTPSPTQPQSQPQNQATATNDLSSRFTTIEERLSYIEARLARQMDELFWFQKLQPIADVDKVSFTGPAPHNSKAAPGSNMVVVTALTFMPKHRPHFGKLPLIVLAHGEIHGNIASYEHAQVLAELLEQGYAVIAPDYRGSAGYGADFFKLIDYGGLEIEDVHAGRQFMLETYPDSIDPKRVGIIGWSHGGLIALMTVLENPDAYAVCYAGVPVSDLEERIRIRGKDYEQLFAAPYHIGKTVAEAPEEYRKRSPAANASKLRTPLLVHANTNDEDVTAREVSKLIDALHAADKHFQYHLYTNAPGGHLFNRLDTIFARQSRREIYDFLANYLKPPKRLPSLDHPSP